MLINRFETDEALAAVEAWADTVEEWLMRLVFEG